MRPRSTAIVQAGRSTNCFGVAAAALSTVMASAISRAVMAAPARHSTSTALRIHFEPRACSLAAFRGDRSGVEAGSSIPTTNLHPCRPGRMASRLLTRRFISRQFGMQKPQCETACSVAISDLGIPLN
jgi:hypothetical protein